MGRERLIERCGGLDVHRDSVVACVRVPGVKLAAVANDILGVSGRAIL